MRLVWFLMAPLAAVNAQPVSYHRQVAPILAMNCHLCHGANPDSAAGGLSTRTWTDLKKGGNLGPVIVPGDAARSPLYQFISGARGEPHRMPLGGPPLQPAELETIRHWIAQGAAEDKDEATPHRISREAVLTGQPLRIRSRIPVTSYISLSLTDSAGAILYLDGGAIRPDRGVAAIGVPGEWIEWTLRRAPDWPAEVRITLLIAYAQSSPAGAELVVGSR